MNIEKRANILLSRDSEIQTLGHETRHRSGFPGIATESEIRGQCAHRTSTEPWSAGHDSPLNGQRHKRTQRGAAAIKRSPTLAVGSFRVTGHETHATLPRSPTLVV